MKRVSEIEQVLRSSKKDLNRIYGVKEIGIFGSYIKEKQRQTSDIDVLVEFQNGAKMDLLKFVNLENYLSELLGVKVDLVMKSALKPRIGKRVLKEVVYI